MMENNSGPMPKEEEVPALVEKKKYTPLTPEEEERAEFELNKWIENHPEEDVPMDMRREYKKDKEEFDTLFAEFEKTHSLEKLHAIAELTPELIAVFSLDTATQVEQIAAALTALSSEDAEKYKVRTAARNDLAPIYTALKTLLKKTKISEPEYEELKTASKTLSRAVGMINRDKIDHTR
jgi:hypothetical protein